VSATGSELTVRDRPTGRGSIRARTTLVATAIVAAALAIGGVGALHLIDRQLATRLDTALRTRLDELQATAPDLVLPPLLPDTGDEGSIIQVLGADGTVISQSATITVRAPLDRPPSASERTVIHTIERAPIGDGGPYRIASRRMHGTDGDLTAVVGAALDPNRETQAMMRWVLIASFPALLIAVAATTWRSTSRVLVPVEAIRSTVAAISAVGLDRRVPEPGGRNEMAGLARTMNDMLERLEDTHRRQHAFVADASHELRTPLASLQAQLDVALNHPESTDWTTLARQLQHDTRRIQHLADNLLFLATADEHPNASPLVEPVDIDEIVLRAVEPLRARGRVRIDITNVSAARAAGDASQLGRLVTNLLDNAERHANDTVCIEVRECGNRTELVVADDGPGIPPEHRQRVFERFTRLDQTRRRHDGGAGLGLAIVKAIADAHHATVAIADTRTGTRVVVTLATWPSDLADDLSVHPTHEAEAPQRPPSPFG
jgi:signal transduction histidine kinase